MLTRYFDCNRRRCLPNAATRPRLAAWWTRRRPSDSDARDLCEGRDIVIVRGETAPASCSASLILTGRDFARGGSVEIFRASSGWRLSWANDVRGTRPWTAPPAVR